MNDPCASATVSLLRTIVAIPFLAPETRAGANKLLYRLGENANPDWKPRGPDLSPEVADLFEQIFRKRR